MTQYLLNCLCEPTKGWFQLINAVDADSHIQSDDKIRNLATALQPDALKMLNVGRLLLRPALLPAHYVNSDRSLPSCAAL